MVGNWVNPNLGTFSQASFPAPQLAWLSTQVNINSTPKGIYVNIVDLTKYVQGIHMLP